ncbi:ATP-binding protein [Streptomyces sp. YIM 98790]|uniref:sensor histidine kinase n=1 Tax=Streptomyces sp. YIM 98790 TaxID=2689077 RepID=UPI00140C8AA5|nr:ATP-binding protein [Streptomyces sp. YIM 98790]
MEKHVGAGELELEPDDLPDGLVIADGLGLVICCNAEAGRLTGLPPAEMLGRPVDHALPLEDPDGRPWWQVTDPYHGLSTRNGQPERNLLLPGGREVLVTARYVRKHPGGPVSRLVVGLRSTEARQRVERSNAELIATVAHELRSPLTSIKGFTATMLDKWDRFTDEQKRLMLQTVDGDADRVTRLITDLLDVSRIDSGRLEIRRQPVRLDEAARRQVKILVNNGAPAERFVLRIAPELPRLWADPDKIDQVLGNLLENALRHGEGTITIEVEPHPPNRTRQEGTAVTVSDQGSGIPQDVVHRVFTRFWRGSGRGGTGLGLYIVKGIVEAHGGTVTVGRSSGGGARFRFILPAGTPAFLA